MCVEDRQEGRELWLIIDRCAGGGSLERQSKSLQLGRLCIRTVLRDRAKRCCGSRIAMCYGRVTAWLPGGVIVS